METSDEFIQSALAMTGKRKRCVNCWHSREGYCSMYSSNCATAVFNHAGTPPWWTSYEEGEEQERRMLNR